MVVSKHHLAHRRLGIQFQRALVSKTYLALVEGVMPSDGGVIDVPIGLAPGGGTILMSAGPSLPSSPGHALYDRESVLPHRATLATRQPVVLWSSYHRRANDVCSAFAGGHAGVHRNFD